MLTTKPARSSASILAEQLSGAPVLLLCGAAALTVTTGGVADAIAIATVLAINAGIGFITERHSERTLRNLDQPSPELVEVLRDGARTKASSPELVPGDVLFMARGARVPADARLLASTSLTVNEAPLTGESRPVEKRAQPVLPQDIALGERRNMLCMGTQVVGGSGAAAVVATGDRTEVGRIQALAGQATPPQTPLQRQLNTMGRQLVWLSSAICAGVFVAGLLRGFGVLPMLKTATSLAVAALPEGAAGQRQPEDWSTRSIE